MNSQTAWKLVGLSGMGLGVWSLAWGLWHFGDPPLPAPHLLYDASYYTSKQLGRTFGGIACMMLAYIAYRKGTR